LKSALVAHVHVEEAMERMVLGILEGFGGRIVEESSALDAKVVHDISRDANYISDL
jgi:hypothetical protein